MQHRTIRNVLLGVAFTGGAWLALTTLDGAAQAADHHRPAAVEQPGGLLGHLLPEQASARAHEVHGQVLPDKPKPAKAEPKPKPDCPGPPAAPKPAKPDPLADEPAPAPVAVEIPKVFHTPTVLVETPPVDAEPATAPTPTPLPLPLPVPAPAVALPALPVLAGPVPAAPPAGVLDQLVTSLTAADPEPPADCGEDPADAVSINRDALRALLGLVDPPAAATPRAKHAPGCHTVDPHTGGASTGATSSGHNTANGVNAELAGALAAPALARLAHARPRSHIPAGRHVAIEPGPA